VFVFRYFLFYKETQLLKAIGFRESVGLLDFFTDELDFREVV